MGGGKAPFWRLEEVKMLWEHLCSLEIRDADGSCQSWVRYLHTEPLLAFLDVWWPT